MIKYARAAAVALCAVFILCGGLLLIQPEAGTVITQYDAPLTAEPSPSRDITEAERVNVNTAQKTELMCIPGIGETLAARIVEYREENGAFQNLNELTNVKGIGEKSLAKMLPYMKLEG